MKAVILYSPHNNFFISLTPCAKFGTNFWVSCIGSASEDNIHTGEWQLKKLQELRSLKKVQTSTGLEPAPLRY